MKKLIEHLKILKLNYGVIGVKQSFLDEGVLLKDVITMRRITLLCLLPMYVKIGGCLAKTDIKNCYQLGIENIIAPMVLSLFSLTKFILAVQPYLLINSYFVCLTKTTIKNISLILKSLNASKLTGVVVGRSDLTKSYNLLKKLTLSRFIQNKVIDAFTLCKKYNLLTTLGGNISTSSSENIYLLYNLGLLDNVLTRNVVLRIKDIKDLKTSILNVLRFLQEWIKYKLSIVLKKCWDYNSRIDLLGRRI